MITDLWIENFKGIGKRQHIPLKPITLLFGANSAGKSTVLHALLVLNKLITDRRATLQDALAGDETVSLGGIRQILHRQTGCRAQSFKLAVAFETSEESRKAFDNETDAYFRNALIASGELSGYYTPERERAFAVPTPPKQCRVELNVSPDSEWTFPRVTTFGLWTNGSPLIELNLNDAGRVTGWVNLLSDSWGAPCNYYDWGKGNSIVEKAYTDFSTWLRDRTFQAFKEKNDSTSSSMRSMVLITDLLCIPKRHEINAGSLLQLDQLDLILQNEFTIRRIVDYLETMIPDSDGPILHQNGIEIKQLQSIEDLDQLYVIDLSQHESLNRLGPLAILGSDVSEETLKIAVGVIRHYWWMKCCPEDEHVHAFPGPWTHEFEVDFDGSALPDSRSLLRIRSQTELAPFFNDYKRNAGGPKDRSLIPEIVDRTVPAILAFALSELSAELSSFTYIGPKRSSVPRSLSTQDSFASFGWGNGLAAWRWLADASRTEFAAVSSWLRRLTSTNEDIEADGYELVQDFYREIRESAFASWLEGGLPDSVANTRIHAKVFVAKRATGELFCPQDLGEGITQVVPVIAALVRASNNTNPNERSLVAIEQPELHLHPSLAAKLGDVLITTATSERGFVGALIETHSEHLILRILRRIRQTTNNELPAHIPPVKPDDVCVLWVDNLGDGTTFQRLRIDDQGEFIDRWPKGFFSERAEELF